MKQENDTPMDLASTADKQIILGMKRILAWTSQGKRSSKMIFEYYFLRLKSGWYFWLRMVTVKQ